MTPGVTYTFTIPAAATNPLPVVDGATADGGEVSFTGDSLTTTAAGGKGGVSVETFSNVPASGAGGLGGAAADSVGTTIFEGGNGASRNTNAAGAGGGGAGDTEAGGSAVSSSSAGGTGGLNGGGLGGGGKTGNGDGFSGTNAGGGGGGGRSQVAGAGRFGGTGGLGQVRLSDGVAFASVKANNTDNLNLATSWTAGIPGVADLAVWDNTVVEANLTFLGSDQTWAGIEIRDPGGLVTIDAINTLTLGQAVTDIDLTAATQDLTLIGPLAMNSPNL